MEGAAEACRVVLVVDPMLRTLALPSGTLLVSLGTLRFIEANLHRPFSISELLAAVPCSRRKLETRFKQDTGRTMEKKILDARVEKARMLLAETDIPIKEVAGQCGFRERERLHVAFRRGTGVTPAGFRRLHRCQPGL
jgi:transcriptional regulator GlxA family with amidase domain